MIEILYLLISTHLTIVCVTLYLHRSQAHRSCLFNPVISHVMRLWLWLTTGMVTSEWVAVHRLHHQKTDQPEDPHSPRIYGIYNVLFGGAILYYRATQNKDMVDRLSHGTPNDWIELHLYRPLSWLGVTITLLIDLALFQWYGILVWICQMIWIPFHAAGVINGLGHWVGYRNYKTDDHSRNLIPIDFYIGGECLHNNHHGDPASAKFSRKWWEFDIGWFYLKLLKCCKLATIRN